LHLLPPLLAMEAGEECVVHCYHGGYANDH
jgi:hypothetical protein